MNLQELLDSVGLSKSKLAKLMGVSRQTVHRMGDEVTEDVLKVIDQYQTEMTHEESELVPVPIDSSCVVNPEILDEVDYILEITPENIALSCTWHDLDNIQVARRFGLSRFRYNEEVQKVIVWCQDNGTSFRELRGEV